MIRDHELGSKNIDVFKAIELLNKGWDLAETYYVVKKKIKVFFPVYIDVNNIISARQECKNEKLHQILKDYCFYSKDELDYLPQEDVGEFNNQVKEVAKEYTKLLGFQPDQSPFERD